MTFRTGYQVNIGRREAGEFIGIVVHRKAPGAIRGNVLWLDSGDKKFPGLRKKEDWNRLQITAKGPQLTVMLNGTKICDVKDDPTDPGRSDGKKPVRSRCNGRRRVNRAGRRGSSSTGTCGFGSS